MESLDEILSKRSEPAPETEKQETTQAAPETEAAEPEQSTETADGKPPIGAIRQAEREKVTKRYTEQVADFEKKLAEQNSAWERRFGQLLETVKPKAEPKPAPDFYENPAAATLHTVEPFMAELRQSMVHNSRLIAEQRHTEEAVKAADDAFTQAYHARTLDPADLQRITSSPNIYDAAVRWHRRIQAQQEIGDDPAAYKERLKAEVRAELEASSQAPQTSIGGPVMPSNLAAARNVGSRTGPAWNGPPPLKELFKR